MKANLCQSFGSFWRAIKIVIGRSDIWALNWAVLMHKHSVLQYFLNMNRLHTTTIAWVIFDNDQNITLIAHLFNFPVWSWGILTQPVVPVFRKQWILSTWWHISNYTVFVSCRGRSEVFLGVVAQYWWWSTLLAHQTADIRHKCCMENELRQSQVKKMQKVDSVLLQVIFDAAIHGFLRWYSGDLLLKCNVLQTNTQHVLNVFQR